MKNITDVAKEKIVDKLEEKLNCKISTQAQNNELYKMLDEFFKNNQKGKRAFCLIHFDPEKEERIPVVTNLNEDFLYVIFKHFVIEMEEKNV